MQDVGRCYRRQFGLNAVFVDLTGAAIRPQEGLASLSETMRQRNYAMQASMNSGEPYFYSVVPGVTTWMLALEDQRRLHGGVMGGYACDAEYAAPKQKQHGQLVARGMSAPDAIQFLSGLEKWPISRMKDAAAFLEDTFYSVSGWQPVLMKENRLHALQQEQINQAILDQRQGRREALYAFEKERMLLANIRAGDRSGARKFLNEMLATIYMSSPGLVVLRARCIELISCLTRAAIEDNPLLEPLIERNHAWTERLISASSFEQLSASLMTALDDFIDGIYLHGVNRSNIHVRKALDFVALRFNDGISLRTVAAEVGLSPGRLCHLVKQYTGRTVVQIIHEVRVRHAQQMLERTAMTCTEIAYETGFSDQSYFIRQFRKITGTTPARYRRSIHRPTRHEAGRPVEPAPSNAPVT